MTTLDPAAPVDLFVLKSFLDERTSREVVAEMRLARGGPATVYGREAAGAVDETVRKAIRLTPLPETFESVRRRLLECKGDIEQHFDLNLSGCEDPHFLRYRVGDFFVAHQDGNTGMLRLEQEDRRVSVVIFLNRQSDTPEEGAYCGGSLVFHNWRAPEESRELRVAGEPGTLVAFRSETTHEVTPITFGERYSIAGWYR